MNVKKILLIQPNYSWLTKRTWYFPPYALCLLKATVNDLAETVVFDPNFHNLSEEQVAEVLRKVKPDLVGITSASTEYLGVSALLVSIVRKTLPEAVIVFGGVIPTVLLEEVSRNPEIDYWMTGEGDAAFPQLVRELQKSQPELSRVDGLAYRRGAEVIVNDRKFLENLDAIPFPDYSHTIGGVNLEKITLHDYGKIPLKYAPHFLARRYPFAMTITTRGCPFRCIFCAGRTVSGQKVRFRSSANVLKEIDRFYAQGIKEVIFLDDHFLADRKRALEIMNGIKERKYDMVWRCSNVTGWLLDRQILETMYSSGCDFLTVSPESGNQQVLEKIVKKPMRLDRLAQTLSLAKEIGFGIVVNFIIGFPGETWNQILDTVRYAESLACDMVNFHIATPLPKTELMDICLREKLLPGDYVTNIEKYSGYGRGLITTKEFTPLELEILRSFEWDRINFSSEERINAIMKLNGITREELDTWRVNTRRNLGVNSLVKNIMAVSHE